MWKRTTLSLLLAAAVSPLCAQQSKHGGSTPIDRIKGDPVQGGAFSEYHDGRGVERPVSAADIDTSAMPPPAPAPELTERSHQGIRWLCGGVGQDEAERMKREARRFDVMLSFTTRDGAYMANVEVEIADQAGQRLLHTHCAGPLMLVDFPGGATYRIRARAAGRVIERSLPVADGKRPNRHINLAWPFADDSHTGSGGR